jgi:hypothetical protein
VVLFVGSFSPLFEVEMIGASQLLDVQLDAEGILDLFWNKE